MATMTAAFSLHSQGGVRKTEWQVQADGLMRNHFHLVSETPQANLVAGDEVVAGREGNSQRQRGGSEGVRGADGVAGAQRFKLRIAVVVMTPLYTAHRARIHS